MILQVIVISWMMSSSSSDLSSALVVQSASKPSARGRPFAGTTAKSIVASSIIPVHIVIRGLRVENIWIDMCHDFILNKTKKRVFSIGPFFMFFFRVAKDPEQLVLCWGWVHQHHVGKARGRKIEACFHPRGVPRNHQSPWGRQGGHWEAQL